MTCTSCTDEVRERTSDGGNGNHSVSLPIMLIKIQADQMLTYSYISSLLVSILCSLYIKRPIKKKTSDILSIGKFWEASEK